MQGEGREKRNDGGDSGPDKPGTSVKVFCASSMFSLSLFSHFTTATHLVRSSDLAPRKMEKDDAPMCSLPFKIFTDTFESKKYFRELHDRNQEDHQCHRNCHLHNDSNHRGDR